MDLATIVFGVLVMRNFNNGLKSHVQRGAKNKQRLADLELSKTDTNATWKIDD